MKTKSNKKRRKKAYRTDNNPAFDLFGEIPVSIAETHAWVAVVAPRWYGSRRMQYYIENWNVAGKIRAYKQVGQFDDIRDQAKQMVSCEGCLGCADL